MVQRWCSDNLWAFGCCQAWFGSFILCLTFFKEFLQAFSLNFTEACDIFSEWMLKFISQGCWRKFGLFILNFYKPPPLNSYSEKYFNVFQDLFHAWCFHRLIIREISFRIVQTCVFVRIFSDPTRWYVNENINTQNLLQGNRVWFFVVSFEESRDVLIGFQEGGHSWDSFNNLFNRYPTCNICVFKFSFCDDDETQPTTRIAQNRKHWRNAFEWFMRADYNSFANSNKSTEMLCRKCNGNYKVTISDEVRRSPGIPS